MRDQPPSPAAPRQAIMPDRSLTCSRAGVVRNLLNLFSFNGITKILTTPRSIECTHLDRRAVQLSVRR